VKPAKPGLDSKRILPPEEFDDFFEQKLADLLAAKEIRQE
jgi:hypothetical protein